MHLYVPVYISMTLLWLESEIDLQTEVLANENWEDDSFITSLPDDSIIAYLIVNLIPIFKSIINSKIAILMLFHVC